MILHLDNKDFVRFWSYVDKRYDCWNWTGTIVIDRRNNKYFERGQFKMKGIKYYAHRISYFINVEITNMLICHDCDNPICVNPDHLYAGTFTDNNNDTVNRNRGTRSLSIEHAKEIYDLKDKMSLGAIAKRFNTKIGIVWSIHNKESYKIIHEVNYESQRI